MIRLSEALKITETSAKPFHIRFVQYDKTRNKGGQIIEVEQATRVGAKYSLKNNNMISIKSVGNSDHPRPVHIHLITEINHTKIFY